MDTYNDDENSDPYGSEGDDRRFGDLKDEDKLSVNLDDVVDEDSDEDAIDLGPKGESKQAASAT